MPIDRNSAQYITGAIYKPTQTSAPGVWDLDDQANNIAKNLWPLPPQAVQRSLRFNSADSAYLIRTVGSGNRQTFTWSGWLKTGKVYTSTEYFFSARQAASDNFGLAFQNNSVLQVDGAVSSAGFQLTTTQVFRDPSAWYHIVMAVDTTLASGRIKLYVNGTQITAFSTETYPAQNSLLAINLSTAVHNISGYNSSSNFWNGYMAEVNFVDGLALTPSSFGQTDAQTGQWIPRVYSGSYGTNGFRLQFLDNSGTTATTLGKDTSGMGNNWTPNNFSVAAGSGNDSLRDVPMNYYSPDNGLGGEVIGNYATLNPLRVNGTLSNGNLDYTGVTSYGMAPATIGMSSGKWYFEMTPSSSAMGIGLSNGAASLTEYLGQNANGWAYYNSGQKFTNGTGAAYGATFTTGDILSAAFDADAGSLTFYKNGVSQGVAYTGLTSGPYFFTVADGAGATTESGIANFGQRPFNYTAPAGYKALCTTNLPAPAIGQTSSNQADNHFDVLTYVGNGNARSITGLSFQPDLVWIKQRTGATTAHSIQDSVRGVDKHLTSNGTDIEANSAAYGGGVTAFNTNGFSIGTWGAVNENTQSYVAWCWNAGGVSVTNNAGTNNATIASTYRANKSAGFSIVTYTGNSTAGATVSHGLGAAPSMIILKSRTSAGGWAVYHTSLGPTQYIWMMQTNGAATYSGAWNNTAPTSSVFTLGSDGQWNGAFNYVAYCFAAVPGFSAFGSYTGNGSTDGPFVYTGFKPKWIMIKPSSTTGNWTTIDTARDLYNLSNKTLYPDLTTAEETAYGPQLDVLSNGFKFRNGPGYQNNSGTTYIYAAFAETPARLSSAR